MGRGLIGKNDQGERTHAQLHVKYLPVNYHRDLNHLTFCARPRPSKSTVALQAIIIGCEIMHRRLARGHVLDFSAVVDAANFETAPLYVADVPMSVHENLETLDWTLCNKGKGDTAIMAIALGLELLKNKEKKMANVKCLECGKLFPARDKQNGPLICVECYEKSLKN